MDILIFEKCWWKPWDEHLGGYLQVDYERYSLKWSHSLALSVKQDTCAWNTSSMYENMDMTPQIESRCYSSQDVRNDPGSQWDESIDTYCICRYRHRRPRYHESPVALRVSLGWLKAKGVNPDSKSGVEPRRRFNGILVTFWQLLHPGTPPSCPDSLSRHWIQYTGTREWGWSHASLPHYNPSHAQVMTSPSAALLTDFAHGHLRQRRMNNT